MIRGLFRRVLESFGLIRSPDFVIRIMDRHPDPGDLVDGVMVLVRADPHSFKWACFRCPCRCGDRLQLSLNAKHAQRWTLSVDWFERPTLYPSVRQLAACRCHFWMKQGNIEWCEDSGLGRRIAST